jgi:putative transposase
MLDQLRRPKSLTTDTCHHYNTERPHSALGYRTPMEVLTTNAAAALEPLAGSALPLTAKFQPEDSRSARP